MMTLETDRGTVVFNARWWPTEAHPVTVTQETVDDFLRVMYVGLCQSQYLDECFSLGDVEFRMAAEAAMGHVVDAFIHAGYDPDYIRRVFRKLGDAKGRRSGYGFPVRPSLRRKPNADFTITVNLPLYPLFVQWANQQVGK